MKEINLFAETNYRNIRRKFGIKVDDRRRHMYVIGKTGMGKTAMIQNMAIQDIQEGRGIGFVDPHGEAAEELLEFVPSSRINDVVYINPADLNYPVAFNVMEGVGLEYRHLVAGGLMSVFKKIWPDVWSARMEYILNNTILALLEYPGSTLLGINRMFSDAEFRKKVIEKITDPMIKSFWVNEYARYAQKYETEATAAIQNKVGQFVSAPLIRNIIGQVKSSIDMRRIMDERKICIMNLSKGRIGEDNSKLLGALLITKLQLAAMSRVDIPEKDRQDFFLYVDEFQNFANESFATILSEARKYRLSLILAHQYVNQMEEEVRDAVFGNVGSMITFRVGAEDAEFLEKELSPEFMATDIVNLAKYNIYLKLMIDGLAGRPFSATTLPPFKKEDETNRDKIINVSRERYSAPRQVVEDKITKWAGLNEEGVMPSSPMRAEASPSGLYDANCSICGKSTKIIFAPDGKRPIYCRSCLKKSKSGTIEKPPAIKELAKPVSPIQEKRELLTRPVVEEKTISLESALKSETVPFSPSKKDNKKKERKVVDLSALREALRKNLGQSDNNKPL
jgi:CxxC-x17-CxxC domain-containing protein